MTADYDAPVSIKVHRVDSDFNKSFVELLKNRGNSLAPRWNISEQRLSDLNSTGR